MTELNSNSNYNSNHININLVLKDFNCPSCKKSFKNLVSPNKLNSNCPTCSHESCPEIKKQELNQNNGHNQRDTLYHVDAFFDENIYREAYNDIFGDINNYFISTSLNLCISDFFIINRIFSQNEDENKYAKVEENIIDKLNHFKMNNNHCKKNENGEYEFPKCSICLVEINEGMDSILLPCEHIFHDNCLIHWLTMHKTCPLCRFELTDKQSKLDSEDNETIQNA